MSEPPFDVAVANRFISSLSKSLQALCHGCMDFDSGIEIVGYINVNIDCGSKVDYVLNEKVSKSTNNSMTFVSNSFLAKKNQPKQTRDGACSPIHQFESQPHSAPYHRMRGFSHSSWNRSGYHGAHYNRGAQKRGFVGDWRGGAKRARPLPSGSSSGQFASPLSTQGLPNETYNSANFGQQQYPQHSDATGTSQISETSQINIKKETFEGSDEAQVHSESSEQKLESGSSDFCGVNIKSDPDNNPVPAGEVITNPKSEALESNDFNGTFLQPTSQDNQENKEEAQTSENDDQKSKNDQTVSFETPFPNPDSPSVTGENENNEGETLESASNTQTVRGESAKHPAIEYDTAAEEASYSEYPDGGEGTSSGQFEVIEIDDEDEDMQAMFGASRKYSIFLLHF
ncbi:hypothetical protein ElyMa_006655700 [Elysia marginata]|uniref:Uncharacterized protein n=1 Tax=Elysia marginata TaxID=1093978 RepID=A0AAV4IQJ3_9GAST|nr:hypothetical protein ElyMa_006655700 [Elysia marginata]